MIERAVHVGAVAVLLWIAAPALTAVGNWNLLVFFVLPGPAVLSREFLVPSVIVVPVYVTMAVIVRLPS